MTSSRRDFLAFTPLAAGAAAAGLSWGPRTSEASNEVAAGSLGVSVTAFGVQPDAERDQSAQLQKAIDGAAAKALPLLFPPGTYLASGLTLRDGSQLTGVRDRSILQADGDRAILQARGGGQILLTGLTFAGAGSAAASPDPTGLVALNGAKDMRVSNCTVRASGGHGVALTACAGAISDCLIETAAATGLFAIDSEGLEIAHNHIRDCGNNGIQVWRSAAGEDGSFVAGNRVERIAAKSGGSGQNGNGINVFRAEGVQVTGNRITDCAFSAVRVNAGNDSQILGNSCARLGEVAIYAEFGFQGALIAQNLVNGAATGISITNFNEGGRLALCQGNLVRNLNARPDDELLGVGISVEADTVLQGNLVEAARRVGLQIGWGKFLRDVSATGNMVRGAPIGIGISGDPNAGYVFVTNNFVQGSKNGAIRAMDHTKPLGADLTQGSAESFRNFAVFANVSVP